jgi:hypothetical protein
MDRCRCRALQRKAEGPACIRTCRADERGALNEVWRRTLERSRKERRSGRMAKASRGGSRCEAQRRNQPDKQDGQNSQPCSRTGGVENRAETAAGRFLYETGCCGIRLGKLAMALGQELENGMRVASCVLQAGLSACSRSEGNGGDCHPDPCAPVASSSHSGFHLLFSHRYGNGAMKDANAARDARSGFQPARRDESS